MRTPQQYIEEYLKCPLLAPVDVKEEYPLTIEFIATIQKEAFECGVESVTPVFKPCQHEWEDVGGFGLIQCRKCFSVRERPPTHLDRCATDQCKVTSEVKE